MKKNLFNLLLIALFSLAGCKKALDLNPLDVPSASTFFTNDVEIQGGVNACYAFLVAGNNGYLSPEFSWDALTETVFIRGGGFAQDNMMSVTDFKNGYFRSLYSGMYQGVARCNLMLQKIEQNKALLTAANINQYKGEVYFLRAYYYLRLINMFGDVVYVDQPVPTVSDGKNVTRSPKADVLKKIYADFDMSAQLLTGSTIKTMGRITAGAALAFKARAALQNNDWAIAAAAAKAVIDLKQYTLMPKYSTLFTEAVLNNNTEQILTNMHLYTAGNATNFPQYTSARSVAGGFTTVVPTQNMLDSYQCIDGLDISSSPKYNKLSPYDNRDPRMKYCFVLPGDMWNGYVYDSRMDKPTTLNSAGAIVKNLDSYNSTVFTSFTGYLVRKYYDFKYATNLTQCETPFMLCRYAEVLLTYAEAKIELNQIDADCINAINLVRGRSDVNMPLASAASSQTDLRKLVRYERKVELWNENLRFDDLRRWKRAEVILTQPIMGRPVLGDFSKYPTVSFDALGDPVYNYTTYAPHPSTDYRILIMTNFNKGRDYLWPIPETELNLNPGLTQNPGW